MFLEKHKPHGDAKTDLASRKVAKLIGGKFHKKNSLPAESG